jgi:hypothetical protein
MEDGEWRMEKLKKCEGNDCQRNMPESFFPFLRPLSTSRVILEGLVGAG